MKDIDSKDYHDFVFKDGKFVGEFEQMYRKSEEVPWHQDKAPFEWHGRIGNNIIEAAFEEGKVNTVLEVGCGLGYIMKTIKRPGIALSGFDISPTAVERAKQNVPGANIYLDDLLNLKNRKGHDLVICRENIWYVVDHLEKAMESLRDLTNPNGFLYVGLCFPALDKEYVGKNVLPNPEALESYLEKYFDGVAKNLLFKLTRKGDGPHFHWLGTRK